MKNPEQAMLGVRLWLKRRPNGSRDVALELVVQTHEQVLQSALPLRIQVPPQATTDELFVPKPTRLYSTKAIQTRSVRF